MKKYLSIILSLCLSLVLLAGVGTASAQSAYPNDTVHIVVTFGAGGGNDLIARAVAAGMEEVIGQSVVVENVTGGGGLTGSFEVVQSEPDGLRILCQDASLTSMFVTVADEVPFALDDLIPVAGVYSCPTWVLSNSEKGYKTLQDFVDDAKANPGKLAIGTAVTTGAQYLMACAIVDYFDLDVIIIPYEGGGELKSAVLGGHVDCGIIHSPILLPEVQEGMVTVLAAGDKLDGISDENLKNVKTLQDYGMDTTVSSTRGFLVPKDTPVEIVDYLEDAFAKALETEKVKEFAKTFGYDPSYMNSEEYSAFLKNEVEVFKNIFENLNK